MAIQISDSEYSSDAFSEILRGIGHCWKHINVRGGQGMIFQELGPLFIKHNIAEKYGIGILHRHFDMAPNERLVEVNHVSTPWREGDCERTGASIVPTSWLFRGNQLIPYEFSFVGLGAKNKAGRTQPSEYPQFLQELATTLKKFKLHRYLALVVHPGPEYQGSVEFTAARANITVHPTEVSIPHTLDAAFFFDPGYNERGLQMKCEFGKCDLALSADQLAEMEKLDNI